MCLCADTPIEKIKAQLRKYKGSAIRFVRETHEDQWRITGFDLDWADRVDGKKQVVIGVRRYSCEEVILRSDISCFDCPFSGV